ncbi:MAG: hypothetical protein J6O49_12745, partial [Bacteroidaceae bacterium]|nr:hypothetical protein [Bacteroidaceae bacterium]
MSYTKQTWQTGDTITAEKLNHIEDGVDDLNRQLNDVENTIETELGYNTEIEPTFTYTDGYAITTLGVSAGRIYESSSYAVSDKVELGNATEIYVYYTGQTGYGNYFFYRSDDSCINTFVIPLESGKVKRTVPEGASYIRFFTMTSKKSVKVVLFVQASGAVYEALDAKLDKDQGSENAGKLLVVGNDGQVTLQNKTSDGIKLPVYTVDTPRKPLLAEFMSHFWCAMYMPNAFTGKNVVLTISGNAGSNELTVSAISPDTLSISDMGTGRIGGLLSTDGETYTVCNVRYLSGSTIEIYPALTETVTDGTISTLMYDSGSSYVGLHLTENGYKAYMQHLYAQNPRHCEVGKYVARFRGDLDTDHPWTWYGGTIPAAQYRYNTLNPNPYWFNRPSSRAYVFQYSNQWAGHTTKSGAYWEVDLKGKSGYLEAYVFAIAEGTLVLPTDQEIYVKVTIDGVEKYTETIYDTICRRIIVDYDNATTGRIEVYSNKWQGVNGQVYGLGFGRVTWWVNDLDYPDEKLFPEGAVIAEQFDSWGVFHDGASGKELERLHNAATGVSVPFTNNSKGDQTSAWGKAWFYDKTKQYNPSICIHDFVINDTNSMTAAGIPATIEGPDGVEYNNKLTSDQYADNMILMGKLATSNGIQPIFMRNCQYAAGYYG